MDPPAHVVSYDRPLALGAGSVQPYLRRPRPLPLGDHNHRQVAHSEGLGDCESRGALGGTLAHISERSAYRYSKAEAAMLFCIQAEL